MLCALVLLYSISGLAASAQDDPAAELGKRIFMSEAQPPCAICHTLAKAGAAGEIGPSLDELKPTEEKVRAAVSKGVGVMPAYEALSEEQIGAVAQYVAEVAGDTQP
jgi:mono/diheme cytochrome c family protein